MFCLSVEWKLFCLSVSAFVALWKWNNLSSSFVVVRLANKDRCLTVKPLWRPFLWFLYADCSLCMQGSLWRADEWKQPNNKCWSEGGMLKWRPLFPCLSALFFALFPRRYSLFCPSFWLTFQQWRCLSPTGPASIPSSAYSAHTQDQLVTLRSQPTPLQRLISESDL